ncbi:MAG: CCA tRNA nucleotidyltransferase [Actinomycetota bacterium]
MSDLPTELTTVVAAAAPLTERFAEAGHRLFLVGGVVRDHLLDRRRADADLDATTAARPEEIKAIVAPIAEAVWTQGERFGTIGCQIDGQPWEITTFRAESYDDDSRKPTVAFGDDIADDLARRDFTVNAMAVATDTAELVDPYGGRTDLEASVLRTPLDPEVSFSEDPLRMLRAARFHAGYALAPTPELEASITSLLDRIAIVSIERVRDELQKLLLVDDPGPGLDLLDRTGLLERVVPGLVSIESERPSLDLLARRVAAVDADPAMRWAALLSGGAVTPGDLRALRFAGSLAADTLWFHSAPLATTKSGMRPGGLAAVRRAAAAAPSGRRLEDQLDYARAIRVVNVWPNGPLGAVERELADLREAEPDLDDPTPVLSGQDVCELLEIAPGPDVGRALAWLRDLRFERGPVGADEAGRRLAAWWSIRDLPD